MPLPAQEILNHFTGEVGAGFTFPLDRLADHTNTGFNFVAAAGPRLTNRFALTLDFSLHYTNLKDFLENPATGSSISSGSMARIWSLTLNPVFEFIKHEQFSAYATGGYGLYNRKLLLSAPGATFVAMCDEFWKVCLGAPLEVSGDLSLYKGGYNIGGGVAITPHIKFFIEARYHHMFTSAGSLTFIPLTFGVRW